MVYAVAIAWGVLAVFLLISFAQVFAILRGGYVDIVTSTALAALVFVGISLAVLRVHLPEVSLRDGLGLRPTASSLLFLGLALGLVLQIPATQLRGVVEARWPTPEEALAARAAMLSTETTAQMVAVLVSIACVGPLIEELFFRGALFVWLRRATTVAGAAVVTSILFTFAHPELRDWPSLLLVAAVIAHLRVSSGSLLPPLALHVGFNATTVIAVFTGVSSVSEPVHFELPVVVGSWMVLGAFVFAVQYVAVQSEDAEQARLEDDG